MKAQDITEGTKFKDERGELFVATSDARRGMYDVQVIVDFRYPGRNEASGEMFFTVDDDVRTW